VALVVGGGLLASFRAAGIPADPELILVLVLPPILYQAAMLTSWRILR
jgi:CPA1 family monovalent cation:H+ antiporter